ncbi:hypothetical protein ACMD2_05646 [Ananas comosus]|uniref:Uncharacterized protein n=1 Tax=Ananas comosus TaxID=4615 RepID=A0A199W8S5_ANACO|nr:hypothetical protein ACMD2_05646 [Ananas comosus]
MDAEAAASPGSAGGDGGAARSPAEASEEDQVRVRRRTLEAVLEQCQRALELLRDADLKGDTTMAEEEEAMEEEEEGMVEGEGPSTSSPTDVDCEIVELCDLLKSKVESPKFLEKLGCSHQSVLHNVAADDNASWDMVTQMDLWDDRHNTADNGSDQDEYVLVRQEDIVDGIACFMATYLLSLKETKFVQEMNPDQLQKALSKTFSLKKKKSKLRKAWDGSKVIYNVVSWGATAIGIYQNPALLRAASAAFWTSCRVISKLI